MIEFREVEKRYPNGYEALRHINLTIDQGEFVAIIGLSGAGKSTLIRTINRMHDITQGTLTVDGTDVMSLHGKSLRKFRRKIGMIFQSFNLITRTTVIKNVLSKGLNLAGDTMGMVWAIFLFIVFTCLIVVYAPSIRRAVLQVLPQHDDMVDRFVAVLHNASRSVFISIVFVPIIQGTLTGLGLRFLDVPDPAFWGLLAVFSAVIPLAGTAIVWLPITVYLGATQSLGSALMLLAWGSIVVSGSDNLLRPYFLKTGIEVSMVVLLLSIVCSLAVFGAVGIIAGPVLVAVARQCMVESDLLSRRHHGI